MPFSHALDDTARAYRLADVGQMSKISGLKPTRQRRSLAAPPGIAAIMNAVRILHKRGVG